MASFTVMVRYGAAPRREMQLNWNKECIMCQQPDIFSLLSLFSIRPSLHVMIVAIIYHDSGHHIMS